jgi:chromate transport protein ChrA
LSTGAPRAIGTGEGSTASLRTIALEWGRIGVSGCGGPPTHIALLRRLVVERKRWIDEDELEAAIAACNLLPGPASTQLAIFCARRVGGPLGAIVGGLAFVVPAVVMVTVLSILFLTSPPPRWVAGAGAGAGGAVAAVALHAGLGLVGPSFRRAAQSRFRRARWLLYAAVGAAAAAILGAYVVLVLLASGAAEAVLRGRLGTNRAAGQAAPALVPLAAGTCWIPLGPSWIQRHASPRDCCSDRAAIRPQPEPPKTPHLPRPPCDQRTSLRWNGEDPAEAGLPGSRPISRILS